jgi:nitrogen fixation protein FixH
MKIFLYIVYPVFFFAMGCGIYAANKYAEGLVDSNYYEKSRSFFDVKAAEEKQELAISKPGALKKGSNKIRLSVSSHGRPLERAALTLFVGNLSSTGYDSTLAMQELVPGIYQATADIPFNGVWLVRIDLKQQHLTSSRKWFFDVK